MSHVGSPEPEVTVRPDVEAISAEELVGAGVGDAAGAADVEDADPGVTAATAAFVVLAAWSTASENNLEMGFVNLGALGTQIDPLFPPDDPSFSSLSASSHSVLRLRITLNTGG